MSSAPQFSDHCVHGSWAMENGAVYRPTTEEHPGPARGPRSGLAAYCFLGRLKWPRRVLKIVQLVSPSPGPGSPDQGGGPGPRAISLGDFRAAPPQPGCSGSPSHTPSPCPFRLGRGASPSASHPSRRAAAHPHIHPWLGPRRRPRAPEHVRQVQEMRRRTTSKGDT